ncbi:hypothetical protein SUGI_0895520 [Cryptomeria japonica]|uniref:uncharacterized protein LOC131030224 n=1 Tax=Cryptomeria japonica TaxID=3369 RepID=UPI002414B630|nr:uncharacterized protein LOC131030224 [Cryptomeria japonica]GLJ43148.1 hypothetical protein SUGI_0895520 [Cryptomeria japonica]
MCQTFLFVKNSGSLQKSIHQDIEALVLLKCNDSRREEVYRGARAAMESVEFQIFAVMNSLSFFSSMGVVMVMIQAMGMNNMTPAFMKRLRRMCSTVTHIGMGSAAIAFISAATALTRRL